MYNKSDGSFGGGIFVIEIYCGTAKGKTRACIGAAIQAAMKDKNVLMLSFRSDYANYDRMFELSPHITRLCPKPGDGVREYFDSAVRMALTFRYGVLILDGVFDAVEDGSLPFAEVYDFLSNAPDSIEIVCSGATADEKILRLADEIVEMRDIRHED